MKKVFEKIEIQHYLDKKIINNPKIYEFVKNHNEEQELDFESQLLGGYGAIFDRKDFILMLMLGIPIGVVKYIDSKGNLILDENSEPIGDIRHIYKPINSIKEYMDYMEIEPFPQIMVNPKHMTKKEVRNLLYCLVHSNNDAIFDFETKNKLQFEIVQKAPLKYKKAMKIFNKYFNKSIQKKFIYGFGVERDRFYYLSGLKKLVHKSNKRKNKERDISNER